MGYPHFFRPTEHKLSGYDRQLLERRAPNISLMAPAVVVSEQVWLALLSSLVFVCPRRYFAIIDQKEAMYLKL